MYVFSKGEAKAVCDSIMVHKTISSASRPNFYATAHLFIQSDQTKMLLTNKASLERRFRNNIPQRM